MVDKKLRFGIVGAGAAGLCAVKHALNFGCVVTAFEKSGDIGGTWKYTDDVGKDKNGIDLFSGMYQGLMTNTPKEIMSFPDFPYPLSEKSFLTSPEVLEYFQLYAKRFDLHQYIKLEHHVTLVRPLLDSTWEISVRNTRENKNETHVFDAVLICSGLTLPSIPEILGQKVFKGTDKFDQEDLFKNDLFLISRKAVALSRLQKSTALRERKGVGNWRWP